MALDATDRAQIQEDVMKALDGWTPPSADSKANGLIWIVAVVSLAILLLAFGLGFVFAELNKIPSAGLNPILTLLVGGFLGFVGGTKATTVVAGPK